MKSNLIVFILLLLSSWNKVSGQTFKNRIGGQFGIGNYFSPLIKPQVSAQDYSNTGVEGQIFYRRTVNEKKDIQLGLGFFNRLSSFSDFSTGSEVKVLSRESYLNIPLILIQKIPINSSFEFNIGSGVYYSRLEDLIYESKLGSSLPSKYQNLNSVLFNKAGVLIDFSLYFKLPNAKIPIYGLIGQKFSFDLLVSNGTIKYINFNSYFGTVYQF